MTRFDITCELPPESGVFAGSPNARGTLDIIWSCFSVFVICTWSVLHLNVPLQTACRTKTQKCLRSAIHTCWKAIWMLVNVLAPEWALGKAFADYRAVAHTQREFEQYKEETAVDKDVPWTKTHTSFANLGGFTVVFDKDTAPAVEDDTAVEGKSQESADQKATDSTARASTADVDVVARDLEAGQQGDPEQVQTSTTTAATAAATTPTLQSHKDSDSIPEINRMILASIQRPRVFDLHPASILGEVLQAPDDYNSAVAVTVVEKAKANKRFFATGWERQRFFRVTKSWMENVHAMRSSHWVLDANQLLLARRMGIIDRLPRLAEDDIADRNKGDVVVKLLAIGQILWFALEFVVRLAAPRNRTPTTLLEVMTFSFAVCTAVTYLLLLDKPKDVQYSIHIPAARRATEAQLARIAIHGPAMYFVNFRWDTSIPNNALHANHSANSDQNNADLITGASCSIFIFGGLHCLAWNFVYPTRVERILWQASSLLTAGAIPAAVLLYNVFVAVCFVIFFGRRTLSQVIRSDVSRFTGMVVTSIAGVLFVASRLFILVEVFRSLAFLPSRTFATTVWSISIPHIG